MTYNLILIFSLHSQYTVRMFPDGLVTVDVVQYINGVSEDKILDRTVSSVLLYSRHAFIAFA